MGLLSKVLTDSLDKMTPKQLKEVVAATGINPTSFTPQAVTTAFQVAIRMSGFAPYRIAVIVAAAVSKAILGRGLSLTAMATIPRLISLFSGPIGWGITGLWTLVDLAGPAYRVTIPSVIQVAYMRAKLAAKTPRTRKARGSKPRLQHGYPSLDHRAVIVAEDITNRFFNVIGLLNKAVPVIAVQLNAITLDNSLILNFVKVLDLAEPPDEDEGPGQEQVDRAYWESKSSAKSIEVMDRVIALTGEKWPTPRVTYNRHHVALGTTGYNFCWFHPRKGAHVHLHLKTGPDAREAVAKKLEDGGIDCGMHRKDSIRMVLTSKEIEQHRDLICEVLAVCEARSRR